MDKLSVKATRTRDAETRLTLYREDQQIDVTAPHFKLRLQGPPTTKCTAGRITEPDIRCNSRANAKTGDRDPGPHRYVRTCRRSSDLGRALRAWVLATGSTSHAANAPTLECPFPTPVNSISEAVKSIHTIWSLSPVSLRRSQTCDVACLINLASPVTFVIEEPCVLLRATPASSGIVAVHSGALCGETSSRCMGGHWPWAFGL